MIAATQSLDVVSLGTNLGIFLGFIVAAILGLKRGIKLIDKTQPAPAPGAGGAVVLEHQSLLFWSESSRSLADAMIELRGAVVALRDSLTGHAQLTALHQRELAELRHEIELLRSQLK